MLRACLYNPKADHCRVLEPASAWDLAENADTDSPWMRCLQGSLGVGEVQRRAEHGRPEQNADRLLHAVVEGRRCSTSCRPLSVG
jgi:hypothetical protein